MTLPAEQEKDLGHDHDPYLADEESRQAERPSERTAAVEAERGEHLEGERSTAAAPKPWAKCPCHDPYPDRDLETAQAC